MPTGSSPVQRPVGIVALLFTDVEDSTVSWETDPAAMRAAMELHNRVLDDVASTCGGVPAIEQGAGDSRVFAFQRASSAISAAVNAQRALSGVVWPTRSPLKVRMAVDAGEVEIGTDGTYSGPVMNRCGRLLAAAHGGQAVASRAARDLGGAPFSDAVGLWDLGSHHLRGIVESIQVFQLCDRSRRVEFPPLRTLEGTPNNLPLQLTSFVARSDELERVSKKVASHRLVTLTGSGGVGKTRLAIELGAELIDGFGDGVWFIDVAPLARPAEVDIAVARVLSLRAADTGDPREVVLEYLRPLRALIVLDNCEHLLDTCGELATALAARCPEVHVLVTSREPLGVHGEQTWRVPSLSTPKASSLGAVERSEAGLLFMDRARLVEPRFALDEDKANAVVAICERLDGIPLAIELAAARCRSLSVASIAAELDHRFQLLTGGGRDVLARQRTLEASVAWSYDLLSEDEARTLDQLSVFTGGFSLEAARAVLGHPAAGGTLERVTSLVDKSLVTADEEVAGGVRFGLLETVRAYAREHLMAAGEMPSTRSRHLEWFATWCSRIGPTLEGSEMTERLRQLEVDYPNIRSALSWAEANRQGATMARLLGALTHFWPLRGLQGDCATWLQRAEEHIVTLSPDQQLPARWCHAWVAISLGDLLADRQATEQVMKRFQLAAVAAGDEAMNARAAGLLAATFMFEGFDTARDELRSVVARCRAAGDRFAEAWFEGEIASTHQFLSGHDLAQPHIDRMATLAHELDNPILLGGYHHHQAWAAVERGELPSARGHANEVIRIWAPFSDTAAALGVLHLAHVDQASGNQDGAKQALEALLDHLVRTNDLVLVALIVCELTQIGLSEGHLEDAQHTIEELWAETRAWGEADPWTVPIANTVALAAWKTGDLARAQDLFELILNTPGLLTPSRPAAIATTYLGIIDRESGQHRAAANRLHGALEAFTALQCRLDIAWVLEELAGLDVDAGRFETSTRLFAAAAALRDPQGSVFRPMRQDTYLTDKNAAQQGLGGQFDEAWQTGYGLSTEAAIALANRTRPNRQRPTLGWDSLTPTELQVLELVTEGRSNPMIAERLNMSRETVKTHLSHIYRKLDLNNRTQLAAAAHDHSEALGEQV